jgi:small-conductance mechanosensitive channel
MLYLAQVHQNKVSGQRELQLLAYRQSEQVWQVIGGENIPLELEQQWSEGVLVLVELGKNQQILNLKPAKDWVVHLVQRHLSAATAITPEFLQQEEARIEQWRQQMTAQSLELTRRQLEIETQREQLQELETSFKQEKERLQVRWQQLEQRSQDGG